MDIVDVLIAVAIFYFFGFWGLVIAGVVLTVGYGLYLAWNMSK